MPTAMADYESTVLQGPEDEEEDTEESASKETEASEEKESEGSEEEAENEE